MRVTAGLYAGRQLAAPKGPRVRPTQDQVRQALFNILGPRVEGSRWLDLYAGSGAIGIEALSRGAAHATFVDRSVYCIHAVKDNLKALGVPATQTQILKADSAAAIEKLASQGQQFDFVQLDPPYDGDLARKTLSALCRYAIVAGTGWVITEHAKRDPLPPEFEGPARHLKLQRIETYGDTALAFYA